MPQPRHVSRTLLFGTILLGILAAAWWFLRTPPLGDWLTDAELALSAEDFDRADELLTRVLAADPASSDGLLLAARLAERRERWDDALAFYGRIPFIAEPVLLRAHCQAADLWLSRKHRIREAESILRRVLDLDPAFAMAHHGLAYLCHQTGRPWSAMRHLAALLRSENFSAEQLINFNLAGGTTITLDHAAFTAADPSDPWSRQGLARVKIAAGQLDEALGLAREALSLAPDHPEPQALVGQLLADRQQWDELVRWRTQLPESALAHPEVWFTQARWAAANGQRPSAIRCGLEALRRYPNHQAANYFVGQLLKQSGHVEVSELAASEFYLTRADRTQQIVNSVRAMVAVVLQRPDLVVRAIDQLEAAGRVWEAWGWNRLLRGEHPETPGLEERADRLDLARRAPVDEWLCLVGPKYTGTLQPEQYPLPDWPEPRTSEPTTTPNTATLDVPFRLTDRAAELGLSFRYDNGAVDATRGLMMYEFTGGGVAAFDYDHDLWPDLFFTQGGPWPVRADVRDNPRTRPETTDRLYRNLRGTGTVDVTTSARLVDTGFGQGVTTGDFDGDGHVDLFVANIGKNQLFRNMGDGTFIDISSDAGIATTSAWSTSVACVDINGDTFPEWFVVNYLGGPDVFRRVCEGPDGQKAICPPQVFPAADDEIYWNNGDGTFTEVSRDAGILVPEGKGLGLVVGQLNGDRLPDLFIANDATPNFFFLGSPPSVNGIPLLQEAGLSQGLAFDAAGDTQACMGIAADDADGNGLLDLYVTNFWLEPNTLYLQSSPGLFSDESRRAGLHEPSLLMLGFGTQFLDGDLDGQPDLFVANGNVGKDESGKVPYEMRPQVYWNRGEARFHEATPTSLGEYFLGKYLGRGVARLDFNRDGRDDLAITHLDRPAALLLTTGQGGAADHASLQVDCVATTSSRDAIGTQLSFTTSSPATKSPKRWTKQLTTGDGYHARNEAVVTFGIGTNRSGSLALNWPSGTNTEFAINNPTATRWRIIEGRDTPVSLTPPAP
jgi:tetratricopeptide (TPR) repeat protein